MCIVIIFISSALFFFFFNDPAPTEIYTLSLHDALPIWGRRGPRIRASRSSCARHAYARSILQVGGRVDHDRSEEHTSELQSHSDLVCRLLLEKKKKNYKYEYI